MIVAAALVSAVFAAVTENNWRRGLVAFLLIVVLQDVFRKLTPGAPSYFILWSAAMFGVVFLAAFRRGLIRNISALYLRDSRLKAAWQLFFWLIVLQAVHAFVRWGSPLISLLGLIFYLGPVAALLVGVAYARSTWWIDRFLLAYVVIMAPSALAVFLSVEFADQWPVLRDIGTFTGTQLIIYDVGTILQSHPGLFRVGEFAAFHAATCVAFLSLLAIRNPGLGWRVVMAALVVALVGVIILTGRRKMLMTLVIFFGFQWIILLLLRKGVTRVTVTMLTFAVAGTLAFVVFGQDDVETEKSLYVERGLTVFESLGERLQTATNLATSAWYRSGGIGVGAGVGGSGARYAGGAGRGAVGGSSEAGLGMVVVELGAPGVLIISWLLYRLVTRFANGLRMLARTSTRLLIYAATFTALLIANAATFGVAAQLYNDLGVLIILGLLAGMLFRIVGYGIEADQVLRRLPARSSVLPGGAEPLPAAGMRADPIS
jgi:hypothetical protein